LRKHRSCKENLSFGFENLKIFPAGLGKKIFLAENFSPKWNFPTLPPEMTPATLLFSCCKPR
jgi:hypothetical protein